MSEGTDKLIRRITEDAQAEADRTVKAAEQSAQSIVEDAKKRVAKIKSDGDDACKAAENEIIFLARKNAELEAKKVDLALRHEVIDEAFSETLKAMRSMNSNKTTELLRKVIFRETSGGETICPASSNEKIIEALIPEINSMLKKESAQPIVLGKVSDEIEDGFIIVGTGYIKKCSYEELLADIKEREIGQIGNILF